MGKSGVYILLVELARERRIRVGRLGVIPFKKGYYAYVGSGKMGLKKRIERHLRNDKRVHWHIDYLLAFGKVVEAIAVETNESLECKLAQEVSSQFEPIRGFGSSDCKCPSHLFYCPSGDKVGQVVRRTINTGSCASYTRSTPDAPITSTRNSVAHGRATLHNVVRGLAKVLPSDPRVR